MNSLAPNVAILAQTQPSGWELLQQEAIKAIPNATLAAIGAALALLVGKRVAAYWALRQKRREIELSTLNDFYRLYGEFFSAWKLWNQHLENDKTLADPDATPWSLLKRALTAESEMESILVKISSERILTDHEIAELGLFRQAFQTLREQMCHNRKIDWPYSEHEEYVTLKRLACFISTMLLSNAAYDKPSAKIAADQLLRITSNNNESRWDAIGEMERSKSGNASDTN